MHFLYSRSGDNAQKYFSFVIERRTLNVVLFLIANMGVWITQQFLTLQKKYSSPYHSSGAYFTDIKTHYFSDFFSGFRKKSQNDSKGVGKF